MVNTQGRRLLAVLAHPDDETFGCGGVLARYAAEGARVGLVCATRGEAGEISAASLATREDLGEVRESRNYVPLVKPWVSPTCFSLSTGTPGWPAVLRTIIPVP